jgi:hypothetical protein
MFFRWRAKSAPTPAEVEAKSEKVMRFLGKRRARLDGRPDAALPSEVEPATPPAKKESLELTKLKLKLDLELQEDIKRVKKEATDHAVRICELCNAAEEWRMMATWIRRGAPLAEVSASLHREISESREIYEPQRATRVAALLEAEVRLGLREHSWGELRVC